ncbi:hypothetical protein O6H91_14G083100 [Diphasiastrum complanatum]|uniref:Uncharacterized protein n=1 Tax=Diphasiastrum complanatum TaxID=34168 RepID=A0ACC2BRF5_DIPCM|nr:hypothetical protein O6H91_14G083100 [Diphasiastrum complanatum]
MRQQNFQQFCKPATKIRRLPNPHSLQQSVIGTKGIKSQSTNNDPRINTMLKTKKQINNNEIVKPLTEVEMGGTKQGSNSLASSHFVFPPPQTLSMHKFIFSHSLSPRR